MPDIVEIHFRVDAVAIKYLERCMKVRSVWSCDCLAVFNPDVGDALAKKLQEKLRSSEKILEEFCKKGIYLQFINYKYIMQVNVYPLL